MKWRHPSLGDTKTKSKFAWLPTRLDNGYTIWLANYLATYQYVEVDYMRRMPGGRGIRSNYEAWRIVSRFENPVGT